MNTYEYEQEASAIGQVIEAMQHIQIEDRGDGRNRLNCTQGRKEALLDDISVALKRQLDWIAETNDKVIGLNDENQNVLDCCYAICESLGAMVRQLVEFQECIQNVAPLPKAKTP